MKDFYKYNSINIIALILKSFGWVKDFYKYNIIALILKILLTINFREKVRL